MNIMSTCGNICPFLRYPQNDLFVTWELENQWCLVDYLKLSNHIQSVVIRAQK